jgi:hypothetical protein
MSQAPQLLVSIFLGSSHLDGTLSVILDLKVNHRTSPIIHIPESQPILQPGLPSQSHLRGLLPRALPRDHALHHRHHLPWPKTKTDLHLLADPPTRQLPNRLPALSTTARSSADSTKSLPPRHPQEQCQLRRGNQRLCSQSQRRPSLPTRQWDDAQNHLYRLDEQCRV